jgi:hypothetical protein
MSATPEGMFSNEGVITFEDPVDDSEILFAGARGIDITAVDEIQNLYTMDSRFRESVKRGEHVVNVDVTYAKLSIEFVQEWLGGPGATATASQDDSDPMLYNIEDVTASEDGGFERTTMVEDVVFPELPLVSRSRDEFEEYDISGTGRVVGNFTDSSSP